MLVPQLQLIQNRIEAVCARARRDVREVTLVGASKTHPASELEPFFAAGLANFGENYVQEGLSKIAFFREHHLTPTWHLIGSLQSNKAREVVAHFDLIHSVDRTSLAKELDKEARKIGKLQRILLQVNVGHEDSKAGVNPEKLPELLEAVTKFPNLKLEGLMSLPPFHENPEETRVYHQQLRALRDKFRTSEQSLDTLSMGMSRDFEIAIEEGATLVRIGTALFGTRS